MKRRRALFLALAAGVAGVAGVFALGSTLALGSEARSTTDRQVAVRTAQLDRYEASLRKALAAEPPKLPPLPSASDTSAAATGAVPVRVVYHRPPPVVVTTHREDGEHGEHGDDHEQERYGGESDD